MGGGYRSIYGLCRKSDGNGWHRGNRVKVSNFAVPNAPMLVGKNMGLRAAGSAKDGC